MSDYEIVTNGFRRCEDGYCIKLKDLTGYEDGLEICGNDIVDSEEHCDGHIGCATDCKTPTNSTVGFT